MNNKFVYCIVLFFISSLTASEKRIEAFIRNKSSIDKYFIIGTHKELDLEDLAEYKEEKSFSLQNAKEYEVRAIEREVSDCFTIKTSDFYVTINNVIDDKSCVHFQQKIKKSYELYKKDYMREFLSHKSFFVHLMVANPVDTKIISLKLTEDQVKQIIQESSVMRSILVSLGAAGLLVFLVCYFDLHSKGMALLGRG